MIEIFETLMFSFYLVAWQRGKHPAFCAFFLSCSGETLFFRREERAEISFDKRPGGWKSKSETLRSSGSPDLGKWSKWLINGALLNTC